MVDIHCGISYAEVLNVTHISEEICYKYLQHWLWFDLMSDHSRKPCGTVMLYSSDGFGLDYSQLMIFYYKRIPTFRHLILKKAKRLTVTLVNI